MAAVAIKYQEIFLELCSNEEKCNYTRAEYFHRFFLNGFPSSHRFTDFIFIVLVLGYGSDDEKKKNYYSHFLKRFYYFYTFFSSIFLFTDQSQEETFSFPFGYLLLSRDLILLQPTSVGQGHFYIH